ncbi:MAG: hypothetical protein IJ785_04615 [Bacteroidales bacterium]|nr:hypothetical protein [Bacteroidales bacterium]
MKKISFIAVLLLAVASLASCRSNKPVAPTINEGVCAVPCFQYGSNVTAQEAKEITDAFRVNFHPSKYKMMELDRVDKAFESRGYPRKKMTKQQMCEVGRALGVKLMVVGTINKLMDEYSVDVQVVNVLKETTVAFEGSAFQKTDASKEMQAIAQKLASKVE